MKQKFELGEVLITKGVNSLLVNKTLLKNNLYEFLQRHSSGDWGNVCDEDKEENNYSIDNNLRILSSYNYGTSKIWIITEADRSSTTVLLPKEY